MTKVKEAVSKCSPPVNESWGEDVISDGEESVRASDGQSEYSGRGIQNSASDLHSNENYSEEVFSDDDDSFKTGVSDGQSDSSSHCQQDDKNDLSDYILDNDYSDAENSDIDRQSAQPKFWETKPVDKLEYNRDLKGTNKENNTHWTKLQGYGFRQ